MRSSVVIVEDEVLPTRGMARFLDHRVVRERPPNIIFTGHHPTDGVRSRQSWHLDRGLSSSTIRRLHRRPSGITVVEHRFDGYSALVAAELVVTGEARLRKILNAAQGGKLWQLQDVLSVG
jgi:hypothetical protein